MKELKANNNYSEFLFAFCLSLVTYCVFSFFPSIIILLKNSQNRKNIKDLFDRLNEDWRIEEILARMNNTEHTFYQRDPITILTEIGALAIKEFDYKTVSIITKGCKEYFDNNVKAYSEDKTKVENEVLHQEFTQLLYNLFTFSLKEKNQSASLQIILARFEIETTVLNNINLKGLETFRSDSNAYRYWSLNFTTTNFFEKSLQFNEEEVGKRILNEYGNFVRQSIPILFPVDFIYSEVRRFESAHKADIVFEPVRLVNELVDSILLYKKTHLFRTIFTVYSDAQEAIGKLNIKNQDKCFLLEIVFNYKYIVFKNWVESDVQNINYRPFDWGTHNLREIDCNLTLLMDLKAMSLLFAKEKLNSKIMNGMKAEMLTLLSFSKENPVSIEILFLYLKKFSSIAGKVKDSDNDYKKDVYIKLQAYTDIVRNAAIQEQVEQKIIDKINETLTLFPLKQKFTQELFDKGFVSDELIA